MREILFKAKRKNWREFPEEEWWIEGALIWNDEVSYITTSFLSGEPDEPLMAAVYEVEPETVCQYTGLDDKNGKKIWENDIAKVQHEKYPEIPYTEFELFPAAKSYTRNYEVEFVNTGSNYGYRCRYRNIHFMITKNVIFNHKIEVIGNIFDNPELLKGGAE